MVSRLFNEPITVHAVNSFAPSAFIWRRRSYRVSDILSWWREPGEWWNGQPVRIMLRVCANGGIYELARIESSWFLNRVLD